MMNRYGWVLAAASAMLITCTGLEAGPVSGYVQTNLVSDVPGLAANVDPNLKNPWGISMSGTSPFWVTNNAGGTASLYNSAGTPQSLLVTIPGSPSEPTGTVFSGLTGVFNSDTFLFSTEGGIIAGWRGALGTSAEVLVNSGSGAVYKGMTLGTIGTHSYIYAADFHDAQITVVPDTGSPALTGHFVDPNLPAGYAPFNIQKLNGQLYVTYALQDVPQHDQVAGPGNGFVDIYDLNGVLQSRFASQGALNAPWGVAVTPAGFGLPAGDVLVGNFGDGSINVFASDGTFVGTLANAGGSTITNSGLWSLTFGNGGNGGSTTSLYLTTRPMD